MNGDNLETKSNNKEKKYKIIILLLLLLICGMSWYIYNLRSQIKETVTEKKVTETRKNNLQHSLDSLVVKYDSIKTSYGNLNDKLSLKDSIIKANVLEIQKLIASQADYRRVQRKLKYLQGITQSYVSQLDSLFTLTHQLTEENTQIKGDLKKEKKKAQTLTKDKEALTEKVNIASALQAYKITLTSRRLRSGGGKESSTDKAKKTDRFKICFTLSKNMIAQSGSKDIYIRIAKPDHEILCKNRNADYAFVTREKDTLQFSVKKNVNYENKSMDVCVNWDKTTELAPGNYTVSIYADGFLIGESSIDLK